MPLPASAQVLIAGGGPCGLQDVLDRGRHRLRLAHELRGGPRYT